MLPVRVYSDLWVSGRRVVHRRCRELVVPAALRVWRGCAGEVVPGGGDASASVEMVVRWWLARTICNRGGGCRRRVKHAAASVEVVRWWWARTTGNRSEGWWVPATCY